jgi:hypothetical protein
MNAWLWERSMPVHEFARACLHGGAGLGSPRYRERQKQRRDHRNQMKQLKALMYGLVNTSGDPGDKQADAIRSLRELCFVITDLESSTAQAAADPEAFVTIQEIHDEVHRRALPPPRGARSLGVPGTTRDVCASGAAFGAWLSMLSFSRRVYWLKARGGLPEVVAALLLSRLQTRPSRHGLPNRGLVPLAHGLPAGHAGGHRPVWWLRDQHRGRRVPRGFHQRCLRGAVLYGDPASAA